MLFRCRKPAPATIPTFATTPLKNTFYLFSLLKGVIAYSNKRLHYPTGALYWPPAVHTAFLGVAFVL